MPLDIHISCSNSTFTSHHSPLLFFASIHNILQTNPPVFHYVCMFMMACPCSTLCIRNITSSFVSLLFSLLDIPLTLGPVAAVVRDVFRSADAFTVLIMPLCPLLHIYAWHSTDM